MNFWKVLRRLKNFEMIKLTNSFSKGNANITVIVRSEKMLELILIGILVVLIAIARNIKLLGEKLLENSEKQNETKKKERD